MMHASGERWSFIFPKEHLPVLPFGLIRMRGWYEPPVRLWVGVHLPVVIAISLQMLHFLIALSRVRTRYCLCSARLLKGFHFEHHEQCE